MRYYIFLFGLLLFSCTKDSVIEQPFSNFTCDFLEKVNVRAEKMDESVLINFGSLFNFESNKGCKSQSFDIYFSEDRTNFEKVGNVVGESGTYLFEDFQNGQVVSFKVVGNHSNFESVVSEVLTIMVGNVPQPKFIDNPLPSGSHHFEDFRLAPDGDRFIYRSGSDHWYIASFSDPIQSYKLGIKAFYAQWNPKVESEIAVIDLIKVTNHLGHEGITSKTLFGRNVDTGVDQLFHEIDVHWDFNNDVFNPDRYWIHEFHFSLDGNSIYFVTNKDNGGATNLAQKVYDNIWKLDLETREIEAISDFLQEDFDLKDFVEDPKQPGNFYVIGGPHNKKVEIEEVTYDLKQVDIYYYNALANSLEPIFQDNDEILNLSVDPKGENLVYSTRKTGKDELWSLNLGTKELKQITNYEEYRPTYRWQHLNWISNNEFMTYVKHEDVNKFAVFNI